MLKMKSRNREGDLKLRVKAPSRGRGFVELEVIGKVDEDNIEEFNKALKRFENKEAFKHYINLGRAKMLCGRALNDLAELQKRFHSEGRLIDVIDISESAELCMRDTEIFDVLKPSIIGAFNLVH